MNIPHAGRDWRTLTPDEFEEQRHALEVADCVKQGFDYTLAHCRAVEEKRSRHAAERLFREVRSEWLREKSGVLCADTYAHTLDPGNTANPE